MVSDERMLKWLDKFNSLPPEAQRDELLRVEAEFYLPARAPRLAYCPDLSRVPGSITEDVNADVFDVCDLSVKARALIEFIRQKFGKRCARAAIAVMQGCYTGAEVGANMGVTRQTADGHLKNLQSPIVQRKAVELGLVTRESFVKAVLTAPAKRKSIVKRKTKAKAKRRPARKVAKKAVAKRKPKVFKSRRRPSPRMRKSA